MLALICVCLEKGAGFWVISALVRKVGCVHSLMAVNVDCSSQSWNKPTCIPEWDVTVSVHPSATVTRVHVCCACRLSTKGTWCSTGCTAKIYLGKAPKFNRREDHFLRKWQVKDPCACSLIGTVLHIKNK